MDTKLKSSQTKATHSRLKAFSYLVFTVFMLSTSIAMVFLVSLDLSRSAGSQPLKNNPLADFILAVLLGIGLLSVSLLSFVIAFRHFFVANKLEKEGRLIDGMITNKWQDTLDGRVLYCVSYRFQEDKEGWDSISRELFNMLDEGHGVPVRYLIQEPSISRLAFEKL